MQNFAIYPIILNQFYIIVFRIETRVLNGDSYYAKFYKWNKTKAM